MWVTCFPARVARGSVAAGPSRSPNWSQTEGPARKVRTVVLLRYGSVTKKTEG